MRRLAAALMIAAAPLLAPGAAGAQTGRASQETTAPAPDVTVRAPERIVCRSVTRTGTRMRVSARCQTMAEWQNAENRVGEYRTIEEASAKLAVIGDSCTPGPQGCD